jgi:hypothetical protein
MQYKGETKTTGQDLAAFQTILDFVKNLHEYYGTTTSTNNASIKALNLYSRLISKMGFSDDTLILRHINAFKDFCVKNRDEIRNRNTNLYCKKIVFTERIFIDMEYIFKKADQETTHILWQHILAISAYLDPENKTKELLQSLRNDRSNEGNFLASMIENVSGQLGNNQENPMAMIGSLMNSDMFSSMMGSMNENVENGNLDLGKLMNSMAGLVDTVKNEIDKSDDPLLKNMLNMLKLPTEEELQN